MPEILEFDIQRAFTIFYKGERWKKGPNKGQWKVWPAALPGVVAWHTPLGGTRRDAFEGARLNEIGLEAGIHDYLFLWGGLYGLEFKKPGGTLSPSQIAMHPRLLAAGMVASETVDDLEAAKAFVRRHGLVQPGR
jgi:hypothetical protein